MPQARMDGTTEEQFMWRIDALREALREIEDMHDSEAMMITADNALVVDNSNAKIMGL